MNKEITENARAALSSTEAYRIIGELFDEGSFIETGRFLTSSDDFCELAAGYGAISGCPAYAFVQNSDICGGAMSKPQAHKIKMIYDLALKTGTPVVGIYSSKGMRLSDGLELLDSFSSVITSSALLSGVVPQISVVLGNCSGSSAVLAGLADIAIVSENARFTLDVSGSEENHGGFCAINAKDESVAIDAVKRIIPLLPSNNLSLAAMGESLDPDADFEFADSGSFVELFAGDDSSAKVGLFRIFGVSAGAVLTGGGKTCRKDALKIARFISFCDAFSIPVITFADSEGFDELGSAVKVTNAYADATTVKITVFSGKAYGTFYTALGGGVSDRSLSFEEALISPIAPEAMATVMWEEKMKVSSEERGAVICEFEKQYCSAFAAASKGLIDEIITKEDLRHKLYASLDMLAGKRVSTMPKKHSVI